MSALGCLFVVILPGPQNAADQRLAWQAIAYWGDNHALDGLTVDPALGPPIAI